MAKHRGWALGIRRFLKEDEVKRLRACALTRAKSGHRGRDSFVREWIVIELALLTGLRVSEIADLRCGDIDLDGAEGSLLVRNGKGGRMRVVRFGADLAGSLSQYVRWKKRRSEPSGTDDPLIRSPRGNRPMSVRGLQKMFERLAAEAGIEGHRFHDQRHTYASHLYRASSSNLRLVQKQLGHASVRTTEIYADVLDEETVRAVNRLYR